MTGEKNSRWTELRERPIAMYMAGAFRSALVPAASVGKLFGRQTYTRAQLSQPWSERRHVSHWSKRTTKKASFTRLDPKAGELVRQCAKTFAAEGKWDHIAILTAVTPVLLIPNKDKGDEIDPSLYVMF